MRCPSCGNDNPDEFPFCIECGARVDSSGPGPTGGEPRPGYDDRRGGYPAPGPEYDQRRPGYDDRRPQYDDRQPAYDDRRPAGHDRAPAYDQGRELPTEATPPRLPQPTARSARLILESGLGKQEYSLDAQVVTIGRSRSNDISLDDARVSRHHARIVRDSHGYIIEDLNSRNGTRVDDRAVRDSIALEDGALVKIGDAVFRFVMTAPAAPAPMSPRQPDPHRPADAAPVVFQPPWSPVQCPSCQGVGTMRPIIYGQAAMDRAAQEAARRGEVALSEGPARPDGPNAECRTCGTRVRIVATSS